MKITIKKSCQQNSIRLLIFNPITNRKLDQLMKKLAIVQNTTVQRGKQVHLWRIITILLALPDSMKNNKSHFVTK
ncbi:hypothetical protein [Aeromonas enteropelogenes]|uniref:hypothetical protein n=1 Tax=Aeromonas enteropelogenes TaxID=29489 RepID=UPI003BA00FB4